MVRTLPEVETVRVPSKPVDEATVVPPEFKAKPESRDVGKVITIFPVLATELIVVKVTVVVPTALATSDAGSTFVEVSVPAPTFSSDA